ncbi:MAG: DmsE family decaheme c-type cytochrome, partial [Gemmatimonadetes bacterium]|nr:DmsE family decaheme c-type cytochrome [Gemmatimonadota bacterium]
NELEARACEACHGPGEEHVRGGGDRTKIFRFGKNSPASLAEQNTRCLQCHESGARLHWNGSVHESRNLACVDCHRVMTPVSPERLLAQPTVAEVCYQCHLLRRAQGQLSSHMPVREGRVTCTDCHNPHGSPTPRLLVENSVNEVCFRCHAERRGPFLWEHPPVTENCLNCHEPHGSMNDNLLRVRAPRLCQRCHIESRHPVTPQLPTQRFAFNRACPNCHSQIHGSNHPAGMRFHR